MATTKGGNARVDRPTATIVILTYNRRDPLLACLAKIEATTTTPAEIIVIDNGSTDGTVAALWPRSEAGAVTVLALPANQGVCARNHALRIARGEFIFQVDDDVIVGPGWDRSLLSAFSNPQVGATGQEGFFVNWAGLMSGPYVAPNFLDDQRPQPGDFCDLVMGYCWAWRNIQLPVYIGQAPDSLPPDFPSIPKFAYDERFDPHWHEETDLQLTIKAAGYRIRCGPPIATHRSLKDPAAARANDPMIGLHHAADHERLLIEKWGGRREDLRLELDRRR